MIGDIFAALGQSIAGYVEAISEMFTALVSIFYTETDGLTFLGSALLIAAGIGVVAWGFTLLTGLIRL